jgi:hypothetical protein
MGEAWKIIPFAQDYAVSTLGRVKRLTTKSGTQAGKILKVRRCGSNRRYLGLSIQIDGQECDFRVHRLVARTFLGEPADEHLHVAHIDGNPTNNHLSNLRWASAIENEADKRRHGTDLLGGRHHQSKLTEEIVRYIRSSDETGAALARRLSIGQTTISGIRLRRRWAWLD